MISRISIHRMPSSQAVAGYIFVMGVVSSLILAFSLLMFLVYIIQLAIAACSELVHTVVSLYTSGDSLTRLFIIVLVGFIAYKLVTRKWSN